MNRNKKVNLYTEYYEINDDYKRNLKPMYRVINSTINFNFKSFLDYGCGKGDLADYFYKEKKVKIYKYDLAIEEFKKIEKNLKVDLIANCDVMEHVPEEEVDDVLKEMSEISKNVFFNIYLKEAKTILPNWENSHCTIKPAWWWKNKINKFFKEANIVQGSYKNSVTIITWNITYKQIFKLYFISCINFIEHQYWFIKSILLK